MAFAPFRQEVHEELEKLQSLLSPEEASSLSASAAAAADSELPQGKRRAFKVFCRVRGVPNRESDAAWTLTESTLQSSASCDFRGRFSFDRVFDPSARQEEVYSMVLPVIQNVVRGVNGSVLCYGQTSTGKTYTMDGPPQNSCEELRGIMPRSMATLLETARSEAPDGTELSLSISMLEVYMEKLRDLFTRDKISTELRITEDSTGAVAVTGLQEVCAFSLPEALKELRRGFRQRHAAATALNDRSSRSHVIVFLRVQQCSKQGERKALGGKLCLVDLAGSECMKKAALNSEGAAAATKRGSEAKAINQSLFALGRVISSLAEQREGAEGRMHVPYRSSKLTRVLQDCLGESGSEAILIIHCALALQHVAETVSTLRFGATAKKVVSQRRNRNLAQTLLLTLRSARHEIERLRNDSQLPPAQVISAVEGIRRKSLAALAAIVEEGQQLMGAPDEDPWEPSDDDFDDDEGSDRTRLRSDEEGGSSPVNSE